MNGGISMKIFKFLLFTIVFILYVNPNRISAEEFSNLPTTNDGNKWRIAYFEGGKYSAYQTILNYTVKGLMELTWAENIKIPKQTGEQTDQLWRWYSNHVKSKYIEFVPDAHYSCQWDDKITEQITEKCINRLNQKKDIDLIIATGTVAGRQLANNKHHTPTIVISTTDAIGAKIIKSAEDSGLDHVNAHVDPLRYDRQVRIFHDIIGFKKLGLIYENTVKGKSYASLDSVLNVSKERGFEVVHCYALNDTPDYDLAAKEYFSCLNKIVNEIDAIYITASNAVTEDTKPKIIRILNHNKIPSFSQSGSSEVKEGFLLSISQESYKYVGLFHADTIARVFNGAKPRQLTQIYEEPPKIAINLKTAEIIGFDPPVDILAAADEIFQTIK
jgi:ABC-type uncharacterized transport system substrate-binding protein